MMTELEERSPEFMLGYELGIRVARPMPIHKKETAHQMALKRSEAIIGVVCGYFSTDKHKLFKRERFQQTVHARQICQFFLRMYSGLQLTRIAELFGQDHTTIVHSAQKVKDAISTVGSDLQYDVRELTPLVKEAISKLDTEE